jgi:hypothetical protein
MKAQFVNSDKLLKKKRSKNLWMDMEMKTKGKKPQLLVEAYWIFLNALLKLAQNTSNKNVQNFLPLELLKI